ncbi:hypothetical protein EOT10_15825 [Streptomyces antnestii]|uniref:Uncharacterized protein n=1 Tax=Streptomyces antnestii TaxID=2494256 RepID=A0A437PQD8_9ACTN|nr:hypothetical protein EOT10_15825 [Streptomyces sp. San01]
MRGCAIADLEHWQIRAPTWSRMKVSSARMPPDAFPWVRFLPEPDVHVFAVELVDTMRAADSVGNSASVALMLAAGPGGGGVRSGRSS